MKRLLWVGFAACMFVLAPLARAEEKKPLVQKYEEVIYSHKLGVGMVLDYLQPAKPNGVGLVYSMSGGWVSQRKPLLAPEQRAGLFTHFLNRGYTLFLVSHGSQPKFKIPEIVEDNQRAIRFIRHNAGRFGIDPNRLGFMGGSAGGHLSLMMGVMGKDGDPKAKDPVDRVSSRVQCVACFCPPTDFLNYGKPGEDAVGVGILKNFKPAFGVASDTPEGRQELGKAISPINFVSAATPPTLIAHGDADTLVPFQQAEAFIKKCEECKVPAKLIRKEKAGHAWAGMFDREFLAFADWFDEHLIKTDKAIAQKHEEVIYGHKIGLALTMDVFTPKEAKGLGVIFVNSGGWFSGREDPFNVAARAIMFQPFLSRGYTVFLVHHGTQPRFYIPEILEDMHRSVRFIRHHAKRFGINPNRIGVSGMSAGGHLSCMLGTTGKKGDEKAADPVDRESSEVQCVACFFPPTDFLNYGKPGEDAVGVGTLKDYNSAFGLGRDSTPEARQQLGKEISPLYFVTEKTAPSLIIHGDADLLVPYQQAEIFIKKCEEMKVPAKLVTKPGLAHGWADYQKDIITLADWLDEHLKKESSVSK